MPRDLTLKKHNETYATGFIFEVVLGNRGFISSLDGLDRAHAGEELRPEDADFNGTFSKITGIREEIESVSWRDGADPVRVRKGMGTFGGGTLTLERGITQRFTELWSWFNSIREYTKKLQDSRRSGNVNALIRSILLDGMGDSRSGIRFRNLSTPIGDEVSLFDDVVIYVGSCVPGTKTGVKAQVKITLKKAWPVAYQVADLDAMTSSVAIESLSLAFDSMEISAP